MPREQLVEAGVALIAHIDAKLAQASNDSSSEGRVYQRKVDEKIIERWNARAIAAEAKLEAIRQGIMGLTNPHRSSGYSYITYGFDCCKKQALALLQPQPQADESGLPG